MPIFGQVWLWSSLAFLLGALLCWGLVALPARRRVAELEGELEARARRRLPTEPAGPRVDQRGEFDQRHLSASGRDDEAPAVRSESLARAYAVPGGLSAPPEPGPSDGPRSPATQYLNVSGSSTLEAPPEVPGQDRGWFDDQQRAGGPPAEPTSEPTAGTVSEPPEPVGSRPAEDESRDEDGGTVFTQRTHPIPGELIRQLDESALAEAAPEPEPQPEPEPEPEPQSQSQSQPAHALPDEQPPAPPTPEVESAAERTIVAETVSTGESKHQLSEDSAVTSTLMPATDPGPEQETEPARAAEEGNSAVSTSGRRGAAVSDQSTPGVEEPKNMPGVTVQSESTTKSKLPKRVPSKPPSRTPFGIQITSPATPAPSAEPASAEEAQEAPRALFEPIVPAGDGPSVPPPPHRLRGKNGRGPFGPGSAMPLPDGAAPSPEYTVKASASAMRYCTPDSEKFGRTVAEVWFRSAADAERVGFRPLG